MWVLLTSSTVHLNLNFPFSCGCPIECDKTGPPGLILTMPFCLHSMCSVKNASASGLTGRRPVLFVVLSQLKPCVAGRMAPPLLISRCIKTITNGITCGEKTKLENLVIPRPLFSSPWIYLSLSSSSVSPGATEQLLLSRSFILLGKEEVVCVMANSMAKLQPRFCLELKWL